jgi:hypothetical protein
LAECGAVVCKDFDFLLCILSLSASTIRANALMMEAASTSETSVNFYQTTLRYNAEDSHLRTCLLENIKSYLPEVFYTAESNKRF